MTLEIRPVTAADARSVALLHHAAWVEAYSALLPPSVWLVR